jgi:hypothetical protein
LSIEKLNNSVRAYYPSYYRVVALLAISHSMNRSVFIGIMVILGLMVLASSLPNKFYGASDRKFIIITIATCIISAIGLVAFFSIPLLTGNTF